MPKYEEEFPLWQGEAPFTQPEDRARREHFMEGKDGIERLTDVTVPSVTWYPCAWGGKKSLQPAVLVCPGGAYSFLSWNHEGRDICALLNRYGFSAFLLKYRCPDRRQAAHADGARAIRFIRGNAEKFGVDPHKVGCIGFSAGGNLCAGISAPADEEPYRPGDEWDALSFRPDFTALIYPWQLSELGPDLALRPEFRVDEKTPPTLLIETEDDGVDPETSIAWFLAMKRSSRPVELHIWPEGGHGYGLFRQNLPCDEWGEIAGRWFRRQAF